MMARGWESKAVEAQMEEAGEGFRTGKAAPRPASGKISRERRSLLLTRTRILNELHATANDRYRDLLGNSLAAIDKQLSALK
ncbi:MAG: hypothetical protein F4X19_03315 [Acidobacteria bacterium]|nr:hypothetical protein [Acidobacteriota bacterium]